LSTKRKAGAFSRVTSHDEEESGGLRGRITGSKPSGIPSFRGVERVGGEVK